MAVIDDNEPTSVVLAAIHSYVRHQRVRGEHFLPNSVVVPKLRMLEAAAKLALIETIAAIDSETEVVPPELVRDRMANVFALFDNGDDEPPNGNYL